jgi:hypothetical protein
MNSLVSIRSLAKYNGISAAPASVSSINGGTLYTGTFSWGGNAYTKMAVFNTVGGTNNFQLSASATVGLLLVGGGGAGGSTDANIYEGAGAGGAGGLTRGTLTLNGNTTYTVSIGSGGAPAAVSASSNNAQNGGNTTLTGTGVGETAIGGGRGGQSLTTGTAAQRTAPQTGGSGGNGGGCTVSYYVGAAGTTTTSQANCSTTTNTKSLTWVGYNGGTGSYGTGGGIGGGGGGHGGAGANGSSAGLGGAGYNFNVGGATPYSNIYVACGGCGGQSPTITGNQSSITSVGGVVGGTSSQPSPSNATTYGSGGCGAYANGGVAGYLGSSGKQGICIILVP